MVIPSFYFIIIYAEINSLIVFAGSCKNCQTVSQTLGHYCDETLPTRSDILQSKTFMSWEKITDLSCYLKYGTTLLECLQHSTLGLDKLLHHCDVKTIIY